MIPSSIISLEFQKNSFQIALFLIEDVQNQVIEMMEGELSSKERNICDQFAIEKRRQSFIMGRYCAKKAILLLREDVDNQDLSIQRGAFFFPIVSGNGVEDLHVSISHTENFCGAIAFPQAYPCGLDIETISEKNLSHLEVAATSFERGLLAYSSLDPIVFYTLLWSAKEALSKVMKTGLTSPLSIFEISSIKELENRRECSFKNFSQYKAVCSFSDSRVLSLILPKHAKILGMDNLSLKAFFNIGES